MKLWFIAGSSIAAFMLYGGAMADPVSARSNTAASDHGPAAVHSGIAAPVAATVIRVASVTQAIAQVASAAVVTTPAAEPSASAEPLARPVKQHAVRKHIAALAKSAHRAKEERLAARSHRNTDKETLQRQLAAAEQRARNLRCVGKPETGTAAWYGGRYVGRRTSSGERLDTTHATAAHRTLPLNSLARVTNLRNGRTVVVRVTDRGPVNDALLIDMSPRAAAELHMKEAGLVPVRVEQVVEVPAEAK